MFIYLLGPSYSFVVTLFVWRKYVADQHKDIQASFSTLLYRAEQWESGKTGGFRNSQIVLKIILFSFSELKLGFFIPGLSSRVTIAIRLCYFAKDDNSAIFSPHFAHCIIRYLHRNAQFLSRNCGKMVAMRIVLSLFLFYLFFIHKIHDYQIVIRNENKLKILYIFYKKITNNQNI